MKDQSALKEPVEVKNAPFERPKTLIEWQGPTRIFEKKGKRYIVTLIAAAGVVMLILFFLHQWVLAFLVAAIAFVLFGFNTVEPVENDYKILTTGIKLDKKLYDYKNLRFFWFKEKGEQKILQVSTYLSFPHKLSILTPEEKEEEITSALLRYLPYHQETETDYLDLLDKSIDFLTPRLPEKIVDWATAVWKKLQNLSFKRP